MERELPKQQRLPIEIIGTRRTLPETVRRECEALLRELLKEVMRAEVRERRNDDERQD